MQSMFFIYFSFLVGNWLFRFLKIKIDYFVSRIVFKILSGITVLISVSLMLLLLGIFQQLIVYALIVFVFIFSSKMIYRHFIYLTNKNLVYNSLSWLKEFFNQHFILKFIILIWLLFYFFISFLPSATGGDALAYHLPFSMAMIKNASISFPIINAPNYGHFPLFAEILFAIQIMIFKNFISFKIVQFFIFILLFVFLLDFCRRYLNNKYLIFLAAILLLSNMPLLKLVLTGGLIDLYVFTFGIISFLSVINIFLDDNNNQLVISAILLGAALSIKYIGWFFAFINGLFLVYFCLFVKKENFKRIFKVLFIYFGIVFLISGFWYAKNFIYTGNPFFPFFSKTDIFARAVNEFVVERNFVGFLIFPFLFFGKTGLFKLPYAIFNALLFSLTYILFIFLLFKRKLSSIITIFFIFSELYLLILFFFSHQIRFAVPVLVFVSLLLVFLIDKIITLNSQLNNFSIYKYSIFLFIIGSLILGSASASAFNKEIKCLIGKTNINSCLSDIALYDIYIVDYINKNLKNEKILDYFNIYFIYNLKNNNHYISDYCDLDKLGINDTNIKNCLEKSHINYLIDDVRMREVFNEQLLYNINNMKYKIPIVEYFIKNSSVVFEIFDSKFRKNYIRLYRLNF